jgi:hypothetical protein
MRAKTHITRCYDMLSRKVGESRHQNDINQVGLGHLFLATISCAAIEKRKPPAVKGGGLLVIGF